MNATRLAIFATLLAAMLGTSNQAHAGSKYAAPVSVGTSSATGSLGGARNSTNTVEYIGCHTSWSSTQGVTLTCAARDAALDQISCTTDDPEAIEAARGINGDSYLTFTWNASYECTSLAVYNTSQYQPKN